MTEMKDIVVNQGDTRILRTVILSVSEKGMRAEQKN